MAPQSVSASTALVYPVQNITGSPGRSWCSRSANSSPSMSGMTTSENTRSMSAPSSMRSSACPAEGTSETSQPKVSSSLPAASAPSLSSSTTSTRAPSVIECERFVGLAIGISIDTARQRGKYTAIRRAMPPCTTMQFRAGVLPVARVESWENALRRSSCIYYTRTSRRRPPVQ